MEDYDKEFHREVELPNGDLLKYVESENVERWIKNMKEEGQSARLGDALERNTDLVPNVYEGKLCKIGSN